MLPRSQWQSLVHLKATKACNTCVVCVGVRVEVCMYV